MNRLSHFFHRRSITLALLALGVSVLAVGHSLGFAMRTRPPGAFFALRFVVLCVLAFVISIHGTLNLIRDVERGYTRGRCSLAAIILFAFVLSFQAALALVSLLLH